MEQNNDNFKDLEGMLRKALSSEKQTGLSAKQLNTLHTLIDQGTPVRRKKTTKWWQLSFAGSVLATAVVAFIVVDRFPGQESGPKTETSDTWEAGQTPPRSDQAVTSDRGANKKPGAVLKEAEDQLEFKSTKSGSKAPDGKREERTLASEKATGKVSTSPMKKQQTIDHRKLARPKSNATVNLSKLGKGPAPAAPAESLKTWESGASRAKKPGRAKPVKSDTEKNKGEAPQAFGLGGIASKDSAPPSGAGGAGISGGAGGAGGSGGLGSSLQNSEAKTKVKTIQAKVEITAFNTTDKSGQILTVVKSRANHIRRCYDAFDATANKGGSITAWWTVTKAGRVASAKITSGYPENEKLQDCVVDAVNRWRFPKNAPATVEVTYKFNPL